MSEPTGDNTIITLVVGAIITGLMAIPALLYKSLTARVRKLEEHISVNGITRPQVEQMIDKAMLEVQRQHSELMQAINRNQDLTRQDLQLCSKMLTEHIKELRGEVSELYERRKAERQ